MPVLVQPILDVLLDRLPQNLVVAENIKLGGVLFCLLEVADVKLRASLEQPESLPVLGFDRVEEDGEVEYLEDYETKYRTVHLLARKEVGSILIRLIFHESQVPTSHVQADNGRREEREAEVPAAHFVRLPHLQNAREVHDDLRRAC